jgi:hypothetical protein
MNRYKDWVNTQFNMPQKLEFCVLSVGYAPKILFLNICFFLGTDYFYI